MCPEEFDQKPEIKEAKLGKDNKQTRKEDACIDDGVCREDDEALRKKEANLGKSDKQKMKDDACYDDGACAEESFIDWKSVPIFMSPAELIAKIDELNASGD